MYINDHFRFFHCNDRNVLSTLEHPLPSPLTGPPRVFDLKLHRGHVTRSLDVTPLREHRSPAVPPAPLVNLIGDRQPCSHFSFASYVTAYERMHLNIGYVTSSDLGKLTREDGVHGERPHQLHFQLLVDTMIQFIFKH